MTTKEIMTPIQETDGFVIPGKGKKRHSQMQQFANYILNISKIIGFKQSSRGWCYQLEGFNVIDKGGFDRIQKLINLCRKQGYLPIDFVAEESSRKLQGYFPVSEISPEQTLYRQFQWVKEAHDFYNPDYWSLFDYYIIMLVEKVDLVTLFEPVCEKYNIKIGNSRGWSSILQRANMAKEFKEHEEKGRIPVILYCGDLDPFGFAISDQIVKNFRDIEIGTGWKPDNLIVDRFGLNGDFVEEHGLTWIENLMTGGGKEADVNNPIVKKFIEQYGRRKVEANAIVVKVEEARNLCKEAIEKYLGKDALQKIKTVKQDKDNYFKDLFKDLEINVDKSQNDILELMDQHNIEWVKE